MNRITEEDIRTALAEAEEEGESSIPFDETKDVQFYYDFNTHRIQILFDEKYMAGGPYDPDHKDFYIGMVLQNLESRYDRLDRGGKYDIMTGTVSDPDEDEDYDMSEEEQFDEDFEEFLDNNSNEAIAEHFGYLLRETNRLSSEETLQELIDYQPERVVDLLVETNVLKDYFKKYGFNYADRDMVDEEDLDDSLDDGADCW